MVRTTRRPLRRAALRILCIADEYPWPATNGYRMRLANMVGGLAEAGNVDLFCTVSERSDLGAGSIEPPDGVRRLFVDHRPPYRPSLRGLPGWFRSGWPRAVAWRDWDGPRQALVAWASPPYDLLWFSHLDAWLGLGDAVPGASLVIDFDNLEDEKVAGLLRLPDLATGEAAPRLGHRARHALGRLLNRTDRRRWADAQRRATTRADAVVVCSEVDRDRLGHTKVVVVPNGFDAPARPVGVGPAPGPVMTLVGLMIYPPNIDAAHFFATRVLPTVRQRVTDARFVVVGREGGGLDGLRDRDGVDVRGEVADLDPVFAATAVVVVPIRVGGGTRIKVLEAWSRGLPVVATTVGCEGLGARHGLEILIADTPDEFAAACVRLLTDADLAATIGSGGHARWEERFQWRDIRHTVADLARQVAAA